MVVPATAVKSLVNKIGSGLSAAFKEVKAAFNPAHKGAFASVLAGTAVGAAMGATSGAAVGITLGMLAGPPAAIPAAVVGGVLGAGLGGLAGIGVTTLGLHVRPRFTEEEVKAVLSQ